MPQTGHDALRANGAVYRRFDEKGPRWRTVQLEKVQCLIVIPLMLTAVKCVVCEILPEASVIRVEQVRCISTFRYLALL